MARLDKNSSIWRVGKLEQLFRRTGLFLWSLKGTATTRFLRASRITGVDQRAKALKSWPVDPVGG